MNIAQVTYTRTFLLYALRERFIYEHKHCGMVLSSAIASNFQTLEGILRAEEFVQLTLLLSSTILSPLIVLALSAGYGLKLPRV